MPRDPSEHVPPSPPETPQKESFHDDEYGVISPAPTEKTHATSGPPGHSEHKVVIEQRQARAVGPGLICGWSKMSCCILVMLIGALAYFIYSWTQIPGLNEQIKRLEGQVDRLEGEVDRLEQQNDRYEILNDELNTTVQELQVITDDLNATANNLAIINTELNATNLEFKDRIADLTAQNEEFARLNSDLNTTVNTLQEEVDRFQQAIATLILENANLSNYTQALEDITGNLDDITKDQNATIEALRVSLGALVGENDRLEELNNGLETIVGFLNETAADIGDSLEQVTLFLADQIDTNRLLVIENIESNSRAKIQTWDCDYTDVYRNEPWATDPDLTIPANQQDGVLGYIDNNVLSELCLSRTDFEEYLVTNYPQLDLTTNRLKTSVTIYVDAAMDWYFPEMQTGENGATVQPTSGVTPEQWYLAGYDCNNLQVQYDHPDEVTVR